MDNTQNKTESEIRKLCVDMIKLLGRAKEEGIINDEEYKNNIKKKVEFLDRE